MNQPKRILKSPAVFVATILALILCSSFPASLPGSAEDEVTHLHRALAHYRFLAVDETAASAPGGNGRANLKMLPYGGRLGDQMFMYASTLAVAYKYMYNMNLCIVEYGWERKALSAMFVGPFEFCKQGNFGIKWDGGGHAEPEIG